MTTTSPPTNNEVTGNTRMDFVLSVDTPETKQQCDDPRMSVAGAHCHPEVTGEKQGKLSRPGAARAG